MAHKDICLQAPCLYVVEPGINSHLQFSSYPILVSIKLSFF